MKLESKFNCYLKAGKLIIRNRLFFDNEVSQLKEGKEYELILRVKKKMRSNPQNSYYWGVVVPIVFSALRDLGFNEIKSKEDAHEIIKLRFLKVTINNESGEYIETFKSTSELSTSEFMDFITEIQQWSSEFLNVYIPDPNEDLELAF